MKKALIALFVFLTSAGVHADELTLDSLYEKFNMRTIYSSYGQRLKYYCESYPKDFFKQKNTTRESNRKLTLTDGDDIWTIQIIGDSRIKVANYITSETYRSSKEYTLTFSPEYDEWRADEADIKARDCVSIHNE